MKVVNKKLWVITITLLVVIECVFTYLSVKSYSNKDITELKEENKINKEMFAMYIENEDGNYEEYKDGESFTIAGYKLNISKSNCVDNKGNAVPDIINNSNNKVTVSSNKTVFCYLYFDKDKSVYAKVVSDYQNNNGAALLSGTESDAYPVHYYTGNITNNNIMYGGYCWKMVITTETGGVKLIYNGSPKSVVETEPIEESEYVVSTNTPTDKPFTFDSSTREWVSGIAGVNSTTNIIEFTVTEAGDYILNYTVDSEKSYDKGSFYLNGTSLKSNISGTGQSGTIDLSDLTTTDVIKVTYVKDSSSAKGSDTVKFSIGKQIGEKTLSCDNSGTDSQIGTSKFNSSNDSPAYVGYMYNSLYKVLSTSLVNSTTILNSQSSMTSSSKKYYFGDNVEYTDGIYTLTHAATYTWADSFDDLVGYYTCRSTNSTTGTSCAEVYYVAATTSSTMYYYALSDGNSYDDYNIKLSNEESTNNGDGTYTLVDPVEITRTDYYNNYSTYKNYYFCSDLTSVTCSDMYYSYASSNTALSYVYYNKNYKYGNSFKYENGTYTLVDTDISSIKQFWNWYTNYNTLSNNHYTCFNTSGTCTSLYYINYTTKNYAYYITLNDGQSVEDAISKMFDDNEKENYSVNKIDSTIKDYIDTWYEEKLLNTEYEKYLENAIFCANREITALGGWNSNGGNTTTTSMWFNDDSLECEDKTDRFTLKKSAGGTEDYGNNTLDYPIGLISYKEASLATGSGYLKPGRNYWWLSPNYFYINKARNNFIVSSGGDNDNVDKAYGVRPVVSLGNNVEITSGNGSVTNPYQVKLSE